MSTKVELAIIGMSPRRLRRVLAAFLFVVMWTAFALGFKWRWLHVSLAFFSSLSIGIIPFVWMEWRVRHPMYFEDMRGAGEYEADIWAGHE